MAQYAGRVKATGTHPVRDTEPAKKKAVPKDGLSFRQNAVALDYQAASTAPLYFVAMNSFTGAL